MDCVDGDESDSYNLNSRKFCYIINNEEFHPKLNLSTRSGTGKDFERLKKLFRTLNFTVENHKNCDKKTTLDNLKKLSSRQDLENYSLFVFIILSHGDEGTVFATDAPMPLDYILGLFKGDNCKVLVGKPKVFFIQACRGDKFDHGIQSDSDSSSSNIDKIPIEADVLIGYSTVPGYFSWRNSSNGSWYIQALCQSIERYAKTDDLIHILLKVNKSVASQFRSNTGDVKSHGMLQIPSFSCMLRKKVWLVEDHN